MLVLATTKHICADMDEWILSGLFTLYGLTILTYCFAVTLTESLAYITIMSSLLTVVSVLIPNYKYLYILNQWDTSAHYGSIKATLEQGHVLEVPVYYDDYYGLPGSRILVASISLITSFTIDDSIRMLLLAYAFLWPFIIYYCSIKLRLPKNVIKWAIALSPIVYLSKLSYTFTGTTFAFIFFVLIAYITIITTFNPNGYLARNIVLIIVLGLTIAVSHAVTTFFTMLFMMMLATLILVTYSLRRLNKNITPIVLITITPVILMSIVNLVYRSYYSLIPILSNLGNFIKFISFKAEGLPLTTIQTYKAFYTLSIMDKSKIILVVLIRKALITFLAIPSIYLILRNRSRSGYPLQTFYRIISIIFIVLIATALLGYTYKITVGERLFIYSQALSPFLIGTTLSFVVRSIHRDKSRLMRDVLVVFILFILFIASIIETFPPMFIIPKYSTVFGKEYVYDPRIFVTIHMVDVYRYVSWFDSDLRIYVPDWCIFRFIHINRSTLVEQYFLSLIPNYAELEKRAILVFPSSLEEYSITPSKFEYYYNAHLLALTRWGLVYNNGFWWVIPLAW